MVLLRQVSLACVFAFVGIVGAVSKLEAFNVLGCNFNIGDNPEGCINGKINDRVNEAKNEANRRVDDANKKAQEAQHQADAARQELQNSPFLAKLRGEQQILQAARSLQIEPLMQCLESARASGRTDVAQYIARLNANPGEFTKWLVEDVWRLIEADFERVMAEEIQGLRNPSAQVFQQMTDPAYAMAKLRRVADKHEAARCLVQQMSPRLPDIQRATGELQSTTRAHIEGLYNQRLKPLVDEAVGKGLRSVITATLRQAGAPGGVTAQGGSIPGSSAPTGKQDRPSSTQSAPPAVQTIPQPMQGMIKSRGVEGEADIRTEEVSSRGITDLKTLLPGGGEVKNIAVGVLSGYLLNPPAVHRSADQVHQLAVALDSPNRQAVPPALMALRTSLDNTVQLPGVAYLDIGVEIMRFIGHKFIDSDRAEINLGAGVAVPPGGAFMVEAGLKAASTAARSVDKIVGGTCGLVPEVGAGACNVALWGVDLGWEWGGRWTLQQVTLFGMNMAFDKFIDDVKNRIHQEQGYGANAVMDDLRRQAGPFAPLVDNLQKEAILFLAESYIKDTRLAIEHYNVSVRELAEASARPR